MTIYLTPNERKTLDWLKNVGWYNWGPGEPYFSDVFGSEIPERMGMPEEQMEYILIGLMQKGLISTHMHDDGQWIRMLVYPNWRTYDFYGELDEEHINDYYGGKDPREEEDEEPLTHAMRVSPFMEEYTKEMELLQKGESIMSVNGKPMGNAMWNLIISLRDLTLWTGYDSETGEIRPGGPHIAPNANWSIKDVKAYFGLTGTSIYEPEKPFGNVMFSFLRLYNWVYPHQLQRSNIKNFRG